LNFELVRTIIRQTSIGVVEQALKIEQRSDVRVRLPVIVTEQAFVITGQARVNVRSDELIVVRKSFRGSELNCAVETLGAAKAARNTTRHRITFATSSFRGAGFIASGLKIK
jgi:hypothetical protein